MKAMKKILFTVCAIALAITCLMVPATTAKASGIDDIPYDGNGLFFGTSVYNYNVVTSNGTIDFESPKSDWKYVSKLRMCMESNDAEEPNSYYPTGYLTLSSKDDTAELVSVKTSSKNLKAIISNKATYKYKSGSTAFGTQGVSLLAKKAGNYKVTITVKLANGKKVKKKATILVTKKPDLSVIFNGAIDKNSYNFTSSKVKVKATAGQKVSGIKLYYCNSFYNKGKNSDGSAYYYSKWKKVKNGGSIKLNKKSAYTAVYEYNYDYSSHSSKTTYQYDYDDFYPETIIKVVYKDKFYGITKVETSYIYKHKKH